MRAKAAEDRLLAEHLGSSVFPSVRRPSFSQPEQTISIVSANPHSQTALTLMEELDRELHSRYPSTSVHSMNPADASQHGGTFAIAFLNWQPAGCGALRPLDALTAELKRVFVKPEARQKGIAKRILAYLESWATELGYGKIRLQTGTRQPESLALYRSAGFYCIPRYGEYVSDPLSICMEKSIFRPTVDALLSELLAAV
jgi:GNAT superfamily N-acetyltransferase